MHSSHPHCCAEHSWTTAISEMDSTQNWKQAKSDNFYKTCPGTCKGKRSVCMSTHPAAASSQPWRYQPSSGVERRAQHTSAACLSWSFSRASSVVFPQESRSCTWDGLYSAHQTISRPICHPLHTYRHGCARKSVSEPLQERAPHPALKWRYLSGLWILGSVSGFQAKTVTASSNAQCGQRPHHLITITISCHIWQMKTQCWLSNLHTLLGFHALLLEQRSVSVWSKGEVKPK